MKCPRKVRHFLGAVY